MNIDAEFIKTFQYAVIGVFVSPIKCLPVKYEIRKEIFITKEEVYYFIKTAKSARVFNIVEDKSEWIALGKDFFSQIKESDEKKEFERLKKKFEQ